MRPLQPPHQNPPSKCHRALAKDKRHWGRRGGGGLDAKSISHPSKPPPPLPPAGLIRTVYLLPCRNRGDGKKEGRKKERLTEGGNYLLPHNACVCVWGGLRLPSKSADACLNQHTHAHHHARRWWWWWSCSLLKVLKEREKKKGGW